MRITAAGAIGDVLTQGRLIRETPKLLNGRRHTWTYTWSAEDRPVESVTPDGECRRYAYDPLGRRISKQRLMDDGGRLRRRLPGRDRRPGAVRLQPHHDRPGQRDHLCRGRVGSAG
ncbi:hypothetical protein [Streptomyces sp. NPDC048473]|uniref:hypothetical protein n=1 Tax=unclassified Streptomyces TaxID=2593676 RepID=UPI003716AF80